VDLFGAVATERLATVTEDELEAGRDVANRLASILTTSGAVMQLGFPQGTAGFGFLALALPNPNLLRILSAVVVLLRPVEARAFVAAFDPDEVDTWGEAVDAAKALVAADPTLATEAEKRGLVAALRERAI
jgi:hypothetical protein